MCVCVCAYKYRYYSVQIGVWYIVSTTDVLVNIILLSSENQSHLKKK